MPERPVRLIVSDDLSRGRWTVLFRLLLAVPHYIWLALWSVIALFAAFANWLAVLILARSPEPLHRFLTAYVKYVTQLYAYVNIAAQSYPSFDAQDGYPIDLVFAPPQRQRRWTVVTRIVLAIPAILLAGALVGFGGSGSQLAGTGHRSVSSFALGGLLGAAAFLAWWASMVMRREPRGLRDASAWALFYGAQLWSYLLLITDRYPDSDPHAAIEEPPALDHPVAVSGTEDPRRSRLTTFFRLPLAVPHLVWLALWSVLVFVAAICNWLLTLARGSSPAPLHRFLSAYVRYELTVYAFLYMVANPFPGFGGATRAYPLQACVADPRRQPRWGVAFRLLLALPALLLASAYGSVLATVAFLGWFASLVTGRMPRGLGRAGRLALRYQVQAIAFTLLLTPSYPHSGPLAADSATLDGNA